MDQIPKWYINMDNRSGRKSRIEVRSQRVGLVDIQRFPAVTVWNDPRVTLLKQGRGKSLTNGEIGCLLSHYDLWCTSVKTNSKIYIQEDDLIYRKDFIAIANSLITYMNNFYGEDNWHIIQLNPGFEQELNPEDYNKPILLDTVVWNCGSYIITPTAAALLIDMLNLPTVGQDHDPNPNQSILTSDIAFIQLFKNYPKKSVSIYPHPSLQDKCCTDTQRNRFNLNHDQNMLFSKYIFQNRELYDWNNDWFTPEMPLNELNK